MKALIFLDYFTPAFKAGGPIRLFEEVAQAAPPDQSVAIVAQNHDWGDPAPLPGVQAGVWSSFANARTYYADRARTSFAAIRGLLREERPAVVHLNSVFSRVWTLKILLLRRFGVLGPHVKVYLAPHGEFAPSALAIKRGRKSVFLTLARFSGLFSGLHWIATSAKEADEIRAIARPSTPVLTMPPPFPAPVPRAAGGKLKGRARFVFLARISAMKNIGLIFDLLPLLEGDFEFHIYGPIDPSYRGQWEAHLAQTDSRGLRDKVHYHGPVDARETRATLARYDFFVQPSLSENFGFSILEALAAGTPAVISNQTPWNDISEKSAGAVLPLADRDLWRGTLQEFIDMDESSWQPWSRAAQTWIRENSPKAGDLLRIYVAG